VSNDFDAILDLDGHGQAAALRAGDVSAAELAAASICRIEATNPVVNAVIHRRDERALAEARALPPQPFAGVPIVVKDLTLMMKGEPYHAGSRALKNADYRAPIDSYTYEKLRHAGFVVVGRTNTPEFGSTITTEPLSYGPSRNPWNPNHSTGGSSGGSAAAVAAGMVAIGHANDGGGSIRVPASECGLVGLKPTRGRVSKGPVVGESWMGATIDHVVTRTVRDSAALLDVLHGPMPGDPYAAPTPLRAFAAEVGADPGHLRIGWFAGAQDGFEVQAECVAAVGRIAELLEQLGHRVDAAHPTALVDPDFPRKFATVIAPSTANDLAWVADVIGRPLADDDAEADNVAMAAFGRQLDAPTYLRAVEWLHTYQRRMAQWWASPDDGGEGYDLLLTPTIAQPPPPIGWMMSGTVAESGQRLRSLMQYTSQFNVTGQPAISLPLHWSADGLPIGVQLVASFGREDVLLRVAAQLEVAAPWSGKRPAIYGLVP
jgi:amidase